jgi:hypothetical protein
MTLQHLVFQSDAILNNVSNGARKLRKGERGLHIERLQAALTTAEFPTFDPKGSYSSGTETAIAKFRDYFYFHFYDKDQSGLVVDSEFINNLDKALRRQIQPVRMSRPKAVAGNRGQAAAACIPQMQSWASAALSYCSEAKKFAGRTAHVDMGNSKHINILSAFYLHFRLSVIKDSFLIPAFLPFNMPASQIKIATVADIQKVEATLTKMQAKLKQPPTTIFKVAGNHPTDPGALASASFGAISIDLHPPMEGRIADSICWIIIHEMVHLFINSPHDKAHPYAHNPDYLALTAAQCANNPDCYAHFCTQAIKGEPQMTPW